MADTTTNGRSAPVSPKPSPSPTPGSGTRFSDAEKDQARSNVALAFQLCGLIADGRPVCPSCGTSTKGKVKLRENGSWRCFKEAIGGDAIEVMTKRGYSFPDAVNLLLGRPLTRAGSATAKPVTEFVELHIEPEFRARVDVEVYDTVRAFGSTAAAQRYYATWHIAPEAVAESGSVVVEDVDGLRRMLYSRFGAERLIACGMVMPADGERRELLLINRNYNVVEPHIGPSGHVVGMQFRPSLAQKAKVDAHKAWKKANDADPATAGPKAEYVPPFLSIRGAGPASLIGCGLYRISRLSAARTVYVVEGFKDLLAARTMGAEAYAIPGTGVMPGAKACELLRTGGHTMLVCLDGDEAGIAARSRLLEHFAEATVAAREKADMPAGMDVADVLVARHAAADCGCETCRTWRAEHPAPPA